MNRIVSFLMAFIVLAAPILLLCAPGAYADEAEIYVDDEVQVSDNARSYNFGKLMIVETEESMDAFNETPVHITFTLVEGVEFPDDADFAGMLDKSSTVRLERVISSSRISVTYAIYGSASVKDRAVFDFGELEIDPSYEGDVEVEIEAMDSLVPSDIVMIGEVLPEEIDVSEINVSTLVAGDTGVSTGIARITETVAGSLNGGKLTVKLPEGVKFNARDPVGSGGTLANLVGQERIDPRDGSTNWELNEDRDKLTLYLANQSTNKRGFLDLTFHVDVDYEAESSDVFIDIEGDESNNIPLSTLYLAKVKGVGVSVSIASVKNITAGDWDVELDEIKIESSAPGSLLGNKYIVAQLENAQFVGEPPRVRGLTLTESTRNKLVWKLADTPRDEYTLKGVHISSGANAAGEVQINFSGSAGLEEVLTVAAVIPPVVVTVEGAVALKAGAQSQAVPSLLIKESWAGAMMAEEEGLELFLLCPVGVGFAARPAAAVVEGDVVLASQGNVYLRDRNNDGSYEEAYIKVEKASTVASALRISNIILDIYSNCPDGPITISVGGPSLVEEESVEAFGDQSVTGAVVGQIVAPVVADKKSNGVFWVGKSYYTQDGSMIMAGVAPYIKNGRVYLPLRNIAYLYGLTDKDIAWDPFSQAVTLAGGGYTATVYIGRTDYKLNGADMKMEVPPEIFNGYTMVPARFLVEALGGKIAWSDLSKSISIQFK